MRSWFSALNEKHRYDASMSNKLRADWLSYMSLLEQAASSGFLSRQSCNSEKRSCHKRREMEERTAYMAIEDCFAAQISRNAVETLRQVRESEEDAFDRFGKEKMAPNGHHYLCVSFNPYKEELRPRANCASLLGRMTYD